MSKSQLSEREAASLELAQAFRTAALLEAIPILVDKGVIPPKFNKNVLSTNDINELAEHIYDTVLEDFMRPGRRNEVVRQTQNIDIMSDMRNIVTEANRELTGKPEQSGNDRVAAAGLQSFAQSLVSTEIYAVLTAKKQIDARESIERGNLQRAEQTGTSIPRPVANELRNKINEIERYTGQFREPLLIDRLAGFMNSKGVTIEDLQAITTQDETKKHKIGKNDTYCSKEHLQMIGDKLGSLQQSLQSNKIQHR